jgi:hypothetical protein
MKSKFILTLSFNLIFSLAFSQNKKEQIKLLDFRIDSIKSIVNSNNVQINNNNIMISDLKSQIFRLNSIIDQNKLEASKSKKTLLEKDIELEKKENEIIILTKNLRELRDSLASLNQQPDTVFWEITDLTWNQSDFNLKLVLPSAKFEKPFGHLLVSRDKKIKIHFGYNNTHWMDQEEGRTMFYKPQDAINYYSKGLHDVEISENNGFIIKGKNSTNELIIIKGIYTELVSMQGRDKGKPNWLWSNTIILKAVVNQNDIQEYNNISNLLIKGFTSDAIIAK